ncbi:MAG: hypothetical protein IPH30_03560 [Betaproteobacteria bacterium]|nr:hypothetical protein [Betaproteobacteria bacterium]
MRVETFAIFLIGALTSVFTSAESPCIECRQAAFREWQVCFASAKSDTDRAVCKEQGRKTQDQCETSKCANVFSDQEKKDWGQVIDFVKNNTDVIREVGSFKHAVSHASYKVPGESTPSRYMVYILGGNKPTYAVVNVSRLSGELKPTLACITHRSIQEFRGPLPDICK